MKNSLAILALCAVLGGCAPPRPAAPTIPAPAAEKCVGTQGYSESFGGRRTFLWRPAWLNLIKTDDSARELRDRIIARAEQSLAGAAPNVMTKSEVPPSGDKHDFLTWPTYWWRTGPNAVEARDGVANPEAKSDKFDESALQEMQARVVMLSLGAFLTGDRRYSQKATELLAVWFVDPATAMNPNMNFAQIVPGTQKPPTAVQAIQLVQIVEAIGLLESSDDLSPDAKLALQGWFSRYVDWMRGPRGQQDRWAPNNRSLGYDLQLIEFALFAGRDDVARAVIQKLPRERLWRQISADGRLLQEVQRTNGLSYSLFALQMMFQLADLGDCLGVDLWSYRENGAGIRPVLDYLVPFIGHEERWPFAQHSKRPEDIQNMRRRFRALLSEAAWIYREERYLADVAALDAGDAEEKDGVWWTGPMAWPDP